MELHRQFSKETGEKVQDIIQYSIPFLRSGCAVHVGTDSQVYGSEISMVTVIAFRYPESKGAHILYRKQRLPVYHVAKGERGKLEYAIGERLRTETNLTLDLAREFLKWNIHPILEFDFNNTLPTLSHKLVSESKWMSEGLGLEYRHKSDCLLAVRAANQLC
jgi:predicted RNase H-related nuclease YkuK (DUF458 family)